MEEILAIIGGVIGLLANVPLIFGIVSGKVKQSFLTYLLWGVLDGVALITIILQDGNFWLPLGYMVGALLVAFSLVFKGRVEWGKIETLVLIFIGITLVFWAMFGSKVALISSVIALATASIPQIIQTCKKPKETPSWIYFLFTLSGVLSLWKGEWNVENKLYSLNIILICFLIFLLSLRKK